MTEEYSPNFPEGTPIQIVHFEPNTGKFKKSKPLIVGHTRVEHLETEPIFGIHITFCDGSKPIEYFNLNLKQTAVVLQEWSDEWILIPDKDCKLNGTVWNWHANARHTEKPRAKESEPKTEEPVEPYFREIEED